MRVLLLHSADNFQDGWSREHWDCVVDLGRAPQSFYAEQSSRLNCPVYSIFDLAVEIGDLKIWRPLFELGWGRLVDHAGIDWWDVFSILLQSDLQDVQLAVRLAARLQGCRTLAATRPGIIADAVCLKLNLPLHVIQRNLPQRLASGLLRRGSAVWDLGFVQARQVVYDKYDPHYFWRRNLPAPPQNDLRKSAPLILLPTAYSNVTKTALNYARLLPDHQFLLAVARESAAAQSLPPNVRSVSLASFAPKTVDTNELKQLESGWDTLVESLQKHEAFTLPGRIGILKEGSRRLRWGIAVRDAWLRVFANNPLAGCLSADDTNPYTRIPLILAAHKGLAAAACHHGALDFRMAFKRQTFTRYLAKGDMERDYLQSVCSVDPSRIHVGAPTSAQPSTNLWKQSSSWITFFAEPYEADFWRVEGIYRELLPQLCAAARKAGKSILLKLHPFDSQRNRQRLIKRILEPSDQKLVTVSSAPMSNRILQNTWCAVTVESTVAFECAAVGIPSFLCGWLRHAYSGYVPQFVRFGVGRILDSAAEISQIPDLLPGGMPARDVARHLLQPVSLADLLQTLTMHHPAAAPSSAEERLP